MTHVPEEPQRFVCENCQVTHAGTPIHESGADYRFEPPNACGACGESEFVGLFDWVHHHE